MATSLTVDHASGLPPLQLPTVKLLRNKSVSLHLWTRRHSTVTFFEVYSSPSRDREDRTPAEKNNDIYYVFPSYTSK